MRRERAERGARFCVRWWEKEWRKLRVTWSWRVHYSTVQNIATLHSFLVRLPPRLSPRHLYYFGLLPSSMSISTQKDAVVGVSFFQRAVLVYKFLQWASGHDESVEVNQRALIDKILARYSGEFTVFRELLQNSDDAQATAVEIRFETQSFLDLMDLSSLSSEETLSGALPDLRTTLVSNHALCIPGHNVILSGTSMDFQEQWDHISWWRLE